MLAQLPFKCGELAHKTYQRPTWDNSERTRKLARLVAAYEISRFILSFSDGMTSMPRTGFGCGSLPEL